MLLKSWRKNKDKSALATIPNSKRVPALHPPVAHIPDRSPETAPTNVVLAQVLQVRRLAEQLLDLLFDR
jgi:hypothetical protein